MSLRRVAAALESEHLSFLSLRWLTKLYVLIDIGCIASQFVGAIIPASGDADFKIKMTDYSGSPSVITIKKDERYFPTAEWVRDEAHAEGWKRITYENGEVIQGEGLYGILL